MLRRGAIFDELSAGLLSHMLTLLFVVGAGHSVRCYAIARAACLLQRSPPISRRFRLGLWVRQLFILESKTDVASRG